MTARSGRWWSASSNTGGAGRSWAGRPRLRGRTRPPTAPPGGRRGDALAEAARQRLAAQGDEGRHLAAMGAGGLAGAAADLERTCLLDDARRFERLWEEHRGRAAREGIPELLAEGHAEVAALGERIETAEGLDARAQDAVADWREVHAEQTALRGGGPRPAGPRGGMARTRCGRRDRFRPPRMAGGGREAGRAGRRHAAPGQRACALARRAAGHPRRRRTGGGGGSGDAARRGVGTVRRGGGGDRPAVGGHRDRTASTWRATPT